MKLAYYSILRYCPDPVKGEAVNVGVLVVGMQHYRFRLIEHTGALRRYLPTFDEAILHRHRAAIDAFFRQRPFRVLSRDGRVTELNRLTRDVLAEFTRRYAGPVLWYTPVARVEGNIESTFALETLRDDLFEQFLTRRDPGRSLERRRRERVKTILRNEFDGCDFFNREKYHHPMAADESLALARLGYRLPVSFCFDNGVLHLFEPIDALDETESLTQFRDVSVVALVFHELRRELGDRVRTYACLVRPPGSRDTREFRILREYATVVDMSRRADREAFFLRLHKQMRPRGGELFHFVEAGRSGAAGGHAPGEHPDALPYTPPRFGGAGGPLDGGGTAEGSDRDS